MLLKLTHNILYKVIDIVFFQLLHIIARKELIFLLHAMKLMLDLLYLQQPKSILKIVLKTFMAYTLWVQRLSLKAYILMGLHRILS